MEFLGTLFFLTTIAIFVITLRHRPSRGICPVCDTRREKAKVADREKHPYADYKPCPKCGFSGISFGDPPI